MSAVHGSQFQLHIVTLCRIFSMFVPLRLRSATLICKVLPYYQNFIFILTSHHAACFIVLRDMISPSEASIYNTMLNITKDCMDNAAASSCLGSSTNRSQVRDISVRILSHRGIRKQTVCMQRSSNTTELWDFFIKHCVQHKLHSMQCQCVTVYAIAPV